jgi:hypothetical protein
MQCFMKCLAQPVRRRDPEPNRIGNDFRRRPWPLDSDLVSCATRIADQRPLAPQRAQWSQERHIALAESAAETAGGAAAPSPVALTSCISLSGIRRRACGPPGQPVCQRMSRLSHRSARSAVEAGMAHAARAMGPTRRPLQAARHPSILGYE